MAIFYRKIMLRSRFDTETCIRLLEKRTKKSGKLLLHDTTHSFFFHNYFVTAMSWWDWYNSASEPKYIGRLEHQIDGCLIKGYFFPGFRAIFIPVLAPLAFLALIIWLISIWFDPIGTNVDPLRHYFTILLITMVFLAIGSGIICLCLHDRWQDDRLIKKLSRVLNAEIIEPASSPARIP